MKNFLSYANSIIDRRNKIRSILMKSNDVRKAIKEFQTGGNNESSTTIK